MPIKFLSYLKAEASGVHMADKSQIAVGFINVVATPHPEGVYARAMASIANRPIRYRGRDYAVILPPTVY